jgi:hypothetical protein
LDAVAPKGTHATLYGFAAHRAFLKLALSWQLDEVSDGRACRMFMPSHFCPLGSPSRV